MTYVITDPCVGPGGLDQTCVEVCPVDCIQFEEGVDRKLYIDPEMPNNLFGSGVP